MPVLAALAVAAALAAPPPVEITAAYFGVFRPTMTGDLALGVTDELFLQDMDDFGWVIELKSPAPSVHWRETLTLPARPDSWGDAEGRGSRLSPDGRTAVTERDQPVTEGAVWNRWSLGPGDPKGRYRMVVEIAGAPPQTFDFTVR